VNPPPALALLDFEARKGSAAAPEAIAFARDLARRRVRAMMQALENDSANRE